MISPVVPSISVFQETLQIATQLRNLIDVTLDATSSWRSDHQMRQIWKARISDIEDFFALVEERFPLNSKELTPEEEEALVLSEQYLLIQQNELRRRLCCPFPVTPLLGLVSTVVCCFFGVIP